MEPPEATLFPLADEYARVLQGARAEGCREHPVSYSGLFHGTERHLQCIWFDSRYRPLSFPLAGGESVHVLDPGEWNLEAGPDFLNATLLITPGERHLHGDVEVHVRPSDWDAHRHSGNPAYRPVIAHVTWFSSPPAKTLPPSVLSLTLADRMQLRPGFALDDIDIKAYPHAVLPETPRPCEAFLKNAPDLAERLLSSAGQYRLRVKAARIVHRLQTTGDRDQVFYEELMASLGYKYNQVPFRALARLLPFRELCDLPRENAFAKLLGCARLLPQLDAVPDEEGKKFARVLWDLWWKDECEQLPETITWRTANLRPQNAPFRRLAAAACLFAGGQSLLKTLDALSGEEGQRWHSLTMDALEDRCEWPFFQRRLAFSSRPDPEQRLALLGENRIHAMMTNVILPFTVAEKTLAPHALDHLAAEDLSAPMRLTALHLFGRDHNPAFYAGNGLYQQGLLQIHLDFCLNARPDCGECPLLKSLRLSSASETGE